MALIADLGTPVQLFRGTLDRGKEGDHVDEVRMMQLLFGLFGKRAHLDTDVPHALISF